uniref:SPIN-DOC-like zinc-finger domain-containing protein n=1 Tax=Monopterus albus TaxID=43700 RepID=A0A3Q3KJB0_MONAL
YAEALPHRARRSSGPSSWLPCVARGGTSEGPDHPLLLSPAPGPLGRKPRVQRASRPGLSRIPGRDHRRYYHEYWRSEYLMDFDPQRHGMICMVCGSSLATLKLSTIKRHIRQKHPDSLLWSTADKEVIRSGWESHLSVSRSHGSYCSAAGPSPQGVEEQLDSEWWENGNYLTSGRCRVYVQVGEAPQPQEEEEENLPGPSAQTLERYLNDSLHAWFRQEFLMEYEAEAGRLLCMVCGGELPSLHLDHIKSHVLDTHPNSLVYSSEEKHCILQAWDAEAIQMDTDLYPEGDGTFTQDTCLIGEDGGVGAQQEGPQPLRQPRKKRLREGDPWRLRLDYLVAYGPQGRGTFCMVCSQVLCETKVSSFRRHIQECHPETTTLSRQEREAMAAAWTKDYSSEGLQIQDGEMTLAIGFDLLLTYVSFSESVPQPGHPMPNFPEPPLDMTDVNDQRRNYQVRWRMEYLMDYDCRRHGLICMVCGATLATLKVSTIKRHIQQVHPHSLYYSPEEKQQTLLSYTQTTLHFIHSDDCFCPQEHGHTELAPSPAHFGT